MFEEVLCTCIRDNLSGTLLPIVFSFFENELSLNNKAGTMMKSLRVQINAFGSMYVRKMIKNEKFAKAASVGSVFRSVDPLNI